MNYFRFTFDKIKQNPHIVFLYMIVFLLTGYVIEHIFGIRFNNADEKEYLKYIFSYKFYPVIISSIVINSFFDAGLWYSFSVDRELGLKEYIDRSYHFFKRFAIMGFIDFLIILAMSVSFFINNKFLAFFYFVFFLLSIFYISVKISLAPAFVVYLDLNVFEAFRKSYFSLKDGYFLAVVLFSIIKNILARNHILAAFSEILMISFICFIFVRINIPEIKETE